MGLYPVAMCYSARHDNTIQYSTVQYNTIPHITHNNVQHSRQPSIRKITKKKKNQEITKKIKKIQNTYYTLKIQKRVEPKVGELVLETTRYTKQWVNHTIQYSVTHISPRPTPHSTSLPVNTFLLLCVSLLTREQMFLREWIQELKQFFRGDCTSSGLMARKHSV